MPNPKFWTQALFEKKNFLKISYEGIAQRCQVTTRTAKNYIKRDLEAGFILRKKSLFLHPVYKRSWNRTNCYFLTTKGKKALGLDIQTQPSLTLLPCSAKKEDFQLLLDLALQLSSASNYQNVLKKKSPFPKWWFRNLFLLRKTLNLFFQKLKKGYHYRSPKKWISSVLKQEGIGYRQKQAQEFSKKIANKMLPQTPFEKGLIQTLKSLQKQGLDTSSSSLQRLLRKGLSHLQSAVTVLEKFIFWKKPIQSLNGMLNWLVRQKDPLELLKPLANSPSKQIAKLKSFFTQNAAHFIFSQPSSDNPSHGRIHIEFLIHPKALFSSVIKLYKKIDNEWKCLRLEMGKTTGNFFEIVIQTLKRHFGDHLFKGGPYVFGS